MRFEHSGSLITCPQFDCSEHSRRLPPHLSKHLSASGPDHRYYRFGTACANVIVICAPTYLLLCFLTGANSATKESENRRCPRIHRGGTCAASALFGQVPC